MTGLVRWEPFLRDFDTLAGRFNQFLNVPWSPWSSMTGRPWTESAVAASFPNVDIYDDGDVLVLEADLPGYTKSDIDVRVQDGVLYIMGERRRPEPEKGDTRSYVRCERAFGRFSRSFSLPAMVETHGIEATFRDGILRLTLPKTEASRPHQIAVKMN